MHALHLNLFSMIGAPVKIVNGFYLFCAIISDNNEKKYIIIILFYFFNYYYYYYYSTLKVAVRSSNSIMALALSKLSVQLINFTLYNNIHFTFMFNSIKYCVLKQQQAELNQSEAAGEVGGGGGVQHQQRAMAALQKQIDQQTFKLNQVKCKEAAEIN